MSAFLGPIHSLMYSRIITVQKVINALAELAKDEGWNIDATQYVIEEFQPIEKVIDLSNIHASLFEMVNGAEKRFAGVVSALLQEHPERLGEIEAKVRSIGESIGIDRPETPEEACARLQELLLDGMPCDRATEMAANSNGSYEIVRHSDLHSAYFEAVGMDGGVYYQLLKAFVEGLLFETSFAAAGDFENHIIISKDFTSSV